MTMVHLTSDAPPRRIGVTRKARPPPWFHGGSILSESEVISEHRTRLRAAQTPERRPPDVFKSGRPDEAHVPRISANTGE